MEKQFFTWESWDQWDTLQFVFHDCVLVNTIGDYAVGTKFGLITVDYGLGEMTFYVNTTDDEGKTIKIQLVEVV